MNFINIEHFASTKAKPKSSSTRSPTNKGASSNKFGDVPTTRVKNGPFKRVEATKRTDTSLKRKADSSPVSGGKTKAEATKSRIEADKKALSDARANRKNSMTSNKASNPPPDSKDFQSQGKTPAAAKSETKQLTKDLKAFKKSGVDFEYDPVSGKIQVTNKSNDPKMQNATKRAKDGLDDFNTKTPDTQKKRNKKKWAKAVAAAGFGLWIAGDYIQCHVDDALGNRE